MILLIIAIIWTTTRLTQIIIEITKEIIKAYTYKKWYNPNAYTDYYEWR